MTSWFGGQLAEYKKVERNQTRLVSGPDATIWSMMKNRHPSGESGARDQQRVFAEDFKIKFESAVAKKYKEYEEDPTTSPEEAKEKIRLEIQTISDAVFKQWEADTKTKLEAFYNDPKLRGGPANFKIPK
tara:strand:- start:128 stop:517 length:390 start_codon:yes stop_codon:yes gene_type:complete